ARLRVDRREDRLAERLPAQAEPARSLLDEPRGDELPDAALDARLGEPGDGGDFRGARRRLEDAEDAGYRPRVGGERLEEREPPLRLLEPRPGRRVEVGAPGSSDERADADPGVERVDGALGE